MVSQEFRSAVSSKNLLLTRIMLKDSLVGDPTFLQFDEMLEYAQKMMPDLFCPFEGDALENDTSKWTKQQMNLELVELVNNFSSERVAHLKKVVKTVMADEIDRIKRLRHANGPQRTHSQFRNDLSSQNETNSRIEAEEKEEKRKQAIRRAVFGGKKVKDILDKTEAKENEWSNNDILTLERAAKQITEAIREYKKITN